MNWIKEQIESLKRWWDDHSCECGATLIILSSEDHEQCMRHMGYEAYHEVQLALANAYLDSAYARYHNSLPGGLCDNAKCRNTSHPKGNYAASELRNH